MQFYLSVNKKFSFDSFDEIQFNCARGLKAPKKKSPSLKNVVIKNKTANLGMKKISK